MAEHKLAKGKMLIRGLAELGEILGYHVEREFPVDVASAGEPPAVDVAWFAESGQRFPLMIFEVESTASNTIANNPLKVFAQDNSKFEKPLFFFQLIASGGTETNRVANLERQYGAHNYRAYILGQDEGTKLVCDILAQHRRIRQELDYAKLYELLVGQNWIGVAAPLEVLRAAYAMGLSPRSRLAAYVQLARNHAAVAAELPEVVERARAEGWQSIEGFDSHVGGHWGELVLCAVMVGMSDTEAGIAHWDKALIDWQNKSAYMPMITPAFGQAHDYDNFLLGLAAPLVALAVAAARCQGSFPREMSNVLASILVRLKPGSLGLQTAVWLCHLAARLDLPEHFAKTCRFIADAGGVTQAVLMLPPSCVYPSELEDNDFPDDGSFECVDPARFREIATAMYRGSYADPMQLGLRALDDDEFHFKWAEAICCALWRESASASGAARTRGGTGTG